MIHGLWLKTFLSLKDSLCRRFIRDCRRWKTGSVRTWTDDRNANPHRRIACESVYGIEVNSHSHTKIKIAKKRVCRADTLWTETETATYLYTSSTAWRCVQWPARAARSLVRNWLDACRTWECVSAVEAILCLLNSRSFTIDRCVCVCGSGDSLQIAIARWWRTAECFNN